MGEPLDAEMLRGSSDLLILSVLLDGPKYGYLIQQRLEQASGGVVRLQAGTLYPLLHRLKASGLLKTKKEEKTGRKRTWYELTAKGRRRLQRQAGQWKVLTECLGTLLRPVLESP